MSNTTTPIVSLGRLWVVALATILVACGGSEKTSSPPSGQTTVVAVIGAYNYDGKYLESLPEADFHFGALRQAGITVIKTRCYHAISDVPATAPPEGVSQLPTSSSNALLRYEADIPSDQVELAKFKSDVSFWPIEPSLTASARGKEIPCLP